MLVAVKPQNETNTLYLVALPVIVSQEVWKVPYVAIYSVPTYLRNMYYNIRDHGRIVNLWRGACSAVILVITQSHKLKPDYVKAKYIHF